MLLMRAAATKVRVLCARELQNSIQDSVHQLLADQINVMGLQSAFLVRENKIASSSGSEFLFKGLRGMKNNAQAIKSIEGVDLCWIEEAQTISADSFQTLTPTIRRPRAEIWLSMNPDLATDPAYQLVMNPPDGSLVEKVNWSENPWFSETSLPAEREWMQRTDPDAYAHVWEGECRTHSDAQVLRGKWEVASFRPVVGADDPRNNWDGPYQGADWGFSSDPSALVRVWIHNRSLYVEHEAYGLGVEIDALPALFNTTPSAARYTTRGDNSRPETISYLKRNGYPNLISGEKWPGSVEDGVAFLRAFERIVIHPRCKHTAEEARLWSYKVDRLSGDVLPALVDKHNHCWDAIRYALQPLIRTRHANASGMMVSGL